MIKSISFLLVLTFFWLFIFEMGSYFLIVNWGDPLLQSYRVLEPDSKIGWKVRGGLDLKFYGERLVTNARGFRIALPDKQRKEEPVSIMTLGPSSAFGWGVSNEATYTEVAGNWFSHKYGKEFSPLNLSQIGYSSFQGKLLLESDEVKRIKPEIVIISYGVNDIDRFRFYFSSIKSDSKELNSPKKVTVQNYLNRSNFFNLVSYSIKKGLSQFQCQWMSEIPSRRVSMKETLDIISAMVNSFKKMNVKTIIINTPHSYGSRFSGYSDSYEEKASSLIVGGKSDRQKIEMLEELVQQSSGQTLAYYGLMKFAAREGECQKAHNYFKIARDGEPGRIVHEINRLNQELEILSKEMSVPLVDAHQLLNSRGEMFVDPIHPSMAGHKIIADSLIEKVELALRSEDYE